MESCRDLNKLHPIVKQNTELFVAFCKSKGLKIGVSETFRTIERQDYLYAQGRTRPGAIVTNAKGSSMSSYHQWGLAVDFFQNIKGEEYECTFMEQVGVYAEQFGFEWGGRWKSFKDTAHIQMTFGLSIQDLKSGCTVEQLVPKNYAEAIHTLVEKGIIGQPGIWYYPKEVQASHIKSLIMKVAGKL